MKRFLSLTLLLLLLLPLCGCGKEASSILPVDDDLTPVLESIAAEVHPGTAGSSLRAAQQACVLMDWCCKTHMDEEQIRVAVEEFLAAQADEDKQFFAVQLTAVKGTADYLISEDGAGLLEDIGGSKGTLWPWADAQTALLGALLDAAGVEKAP